MTDFKSLLVPFGGNDNEVNALEIAFQLAEKFSAQAQVLHVSPDPESFIAAAYSGLGMPVPTSDKISLDIRKHNEEKLEYARKKFHQIAEKYNIEQNEKVILPDRGSTSFQSAFGDAEQIVAIKGRLADLIIMSRTIREVNSDYNSAMISALFNSGRPVLFTPPGDIDNEINRNVIIAWNASAEAARAVAFAMPLLKHQATKTKVWVLTQHTTESVDFPITAEALCLYLKLHDIEAEAVLVNNKGLSLPVAILNETKNLDAGMIVLGAYSHSRVREIILGGVTNFMLENAVVPIFMAH